MDILQQNFTGPVKARAGGWFEEGEELYSDEHLLSDSIVRDPNGVQKSLSKLTAALLITPLKDRLADFKSQYLFVQNIEAAVEHIIESQDSENVTRNSAFLKQVIRQLRAMTSFMDAREALLEEYDGIEIERAGECWHYPKNGSNSFEPLPFKGFARNKKKKRHSPEELAEAEKKGIYLHIGSQRLPRGCVTILELWRRDVNAVIASILQTNDTNETREQDADMQDSYFALERDSKTGRPRRQMQVMVFRRVKYERARPHFREEPLSLLAPFLDKLPRVTRTLTQGRICFVWQFETYSDVPGMREGEEGTAWELEDMI